MANYTINDISLGDVDGDGKVDFIVKRKNQTDQDELFPASNLQMYCQIEVYASTINYGRLWWIDCGPNICYGADEQWDAVAFDWNEDGSCEVPVGLAQPVQGGIDGLLTSHLVSLCVKLFDDAPVRALVGDGESGGLRNVGVMPKHDPMVHAAPPSCLPWPV